MCFREYNMSLQNFYPQNLHYGKSNFISHHTILIFMLFLERIATLSEYEQYMNQNQLLKYQNLRKLVKGKPGLEENISELIEEFKKDIESEHKFHLTDYESFLWKSKLTNKVDYPSIFKSIKIRKQEEELTFKEEILNLNFSPLAYTTKQLVEMSTKMILFNDFSEKNFTHQNVHELISKIASHYNIVSYHNFSHGFNLSYVNFVLQKLLFECFKADKDLESLFSTEQITYALIAGITHDINHGKIFSIAGGTNNSYEVKMNSQLAKSAQNDAVLQKMHIRTFFNILKKHPNLDILSKSTHPQKMKDFMTRIILSTDISRHFKNLDKFKKIIQVKEKSFKEEDDRYFLMENLFHACDIGNPCLSYNQYMNWASLLTYQFNEQYKLEEKNQLEVTKFFAFKGNLQFYQDQVGFVNAVVFPLWKELSVHWPGLDILVKNLQNNLKEIEQKIDEQKF